MTVDESAGRIMFRTGYILGPRADTVWFFALPFAAIGIALACHHFLPLMALASVGLWVTIPHHFATWIRTYGLREDWVRWKQPLIVGPLVVMGATVLGMRLAPNSLLLLTLLWDHQHSLMQQHGLARIYDVKARTGGPETGRFDLLLNWFLYGNMLLTAPLFVRLWGAELYRWPLPVDAQTLVWIQRLSYTSLAVFLVIYAWHVWRSVSSGQALNPLKYLFLSSSYFLWYFTSWQSDSLLVFGIAHRLMHGIQYMVFVNTYLGRKLAKAAPVADPDSAQSPLILPGWISKLIISRRTAAFVGMGLVYVLIYQLLLLRPLDEMGFGVVNFQGVGPQPRPGMSDVSRASAYDLFAMVVIQALPVTHYYFDSFIWKVRDAQVRQGL